MQIRKREFEMVGGGILHIGLGGFIERKFLSSLLLATHAIRIFLIKKWTEIFYKMVYKKFSTIFFFFFFFL
jgi:hypothetical protein